MSSYYLYKIKKIDETSCNEEDHAGNYINVNYIRVEWSDLMHSNCWGGGFTALTF